MPPSSICFVVNSEVVNINPSSDHSYEQWKHDADYAVTRIMQLVKKGRIDLAGEPLTSIVLIDDDSEHITLFEALEDMYAPEDHASGQVIYESPDETVCMTEHLPETIMPSGSSSSDMGNQWDTADTKYMLDKYLEYMPKVGPMKKFKNKQALWNRISVDMWKKFKIIRNAGQIENRYKTTLRRKKEAVNHNSKSGNSRQQIPFELELTKIAALDDSVEPELLRSSKNVKTFKKVCDSHERTDVHESDSDADDSNEKPSLQLDKKAEGDKKRKLSMPDLIQKLHDDKEKAKQKRHIEKMNMMVKLFGNSSDS